MQNDLPVRTPTAEENTKAILVALYQAAMLRYDMQVTGFTAAGLAMKAPNDPLPVASVETHKEWAMNAFTHVLGSVGDDSPYYPALIQLRDALLRHLEKDQSRSVPPMTLPR
jgi:hypothetical protein